MSRLSHAIVFVSNMARSIAFYRDALGLTPRFQSPEWTEFSTGDTTLALHLAGTPAGKAADPGATPAGQCHVGFAVDDIDAMHGKLTAAGATCLRPPREEHGIRLANYIDPDGTGISISATVAPR
jgi:lactoylglutathione lyase